MEMHSKAGEYMGILKCILTEFPRRSPHISVLNLFRCEEYQ